MRSPVAWATLFALLCSCNRPCQWSCAHIPGKMGSDITRISYVTSDPIQGIDLNFLNTCDKIHVYLQTSCPLPSCEGMVLVTLATENATLTRPAPLHDGGERVSLSEELEVFLITALLDEETVMISLPGGYCEAITPEAFPALYRKLNKYPYRLPISIPV